MPIGCGARHLRRSDHARGTGTILDNHGLADARRQLIGQHAGKEVDPGTRRRRNHKNHGALRPDKRRRRLRMRERRREEKPEAEHTAHEAHQASGRTAHNRPGNHRDDPAHNG